MKVALFAVVDMLIWEHLFERKGLNKRGINLKTS